MDEPQYLDLISKYLTGNCTPEEEQRLSTWLESAPDNRRFFEEMRQLWELSSSASDADADVDTAAAWQRVSERIEPQQTTAQRQSLKGSTRFILRVAAGVLLILAAAWWLFPTNDTIEPVILMTAANEQQRLQLPDGTQVTLNADTRLEYLPDFEEREVRLSGEAFFSVVRDSSRPFRVQTDALLTTVLGTAFNVRAYPQDDAIEVLVEEGRVEVAFAKKEQDTVAGTSLLLGAGESALYQRQSGALNPGAGGQNVGAWRSGNFKFDTAPLSVVLADLQRYYDVKIRVSNKDLLNCTFSFERQQPDLQVVLEWISFSMGLEVKQESQRSYLIRGEASCD